MKKVLIEFSEPYDDANAHAVLQEWKMYDNGSIDITFNYSQTTIRQVLVISLCAPIVMNTTTLSEQEICDGLEKNFQDLNFKIRLETLVQNQSRLKVNVYYEEEENNFRNLSTIVKYNGQKYKSNNLPTCLVPKKKKKRFTI